MKHIPLTQGQFATVDDEDFERLSNYKWHAVWKDKPQTYYAATNSIIDGNRRILHMHRFLMGVPKDHKSRVDHIDHNGLNNQKSNLRVCTHQQNCQNRAKHKFNIHGLPKGVSFYSKKQLEKPFRANICVNKKRINLGYFATKEEAATAYNVAASQYFGEFDCYASTHKPSKV